MARVFLTAFLLSAALVVTLALPYPQEEATEAPPAATEATTATPAGNTNNGNAQFGIFQANCTQWREQCSNNGNQIQNNAGQFNNQTVTAPPTPEQMNQVPNNTNAFCTNEQMIQMCGNGGNINQIQNPIQIINTNQTMVVPTMQPMTMQPMTIQPMTIQPVTMAPVEFNPNQFNQSQINMPIYGK